MNFAHGNDLKLDIFHTEANQKHLFLKQKPQLGTGYIKNIFKGKRGEGEKKKKSPFLVMQVKHCNRRMKYKRKSHGNSALEGTSCILQSFTVLSNSMLFLSLTNSLKLNFNLQAKSINLTSFGSLVDSAPRSNNPLQGA